MIPSIPGDIVSLLTHDETATLRELEKFTAKGKECVATEVKLLAAKLAGVAEYLRCRSLGDSVDSAKAAGRAMNVKAREAVKFCEPDGPFLDGLWN
jgi:hypothetical protein